ncbi:mannose-1-phosphate guanylyltransferase/mannose-6-phosphate isomerase [Pikeienuella piscinae]|uniref:mannose-1-phosphate guanylyltransferase n=1 Tax=Pikeienuella piscinae TaxID=2748098 RepID=A0A7L5C0D8_9RHOB|nr:mannose-1-phosphate guanylyltransferase/mannose-6-phosphate isomerase [Pikeienuella piscinae]QIE55614.1 mannose-1-phosphate guanylyltransferase/mannose-6-phosphate isomerase [Pikeienuella piscinae]
MIHPVILCGGSGTRLWPSSRAAFPKQFSPLLGAESLYQTTLRRLSGEGFAAPLVMTAADFRFLAMEQAAAIGLMDAQVMIEPVGRNTAAAVLVAALSLASDPEALMLVAPSDHVIADVTAFHAAVEVGVEAARAGRLVTFGVPPTRAETGYGYLELLKPATEGEAAEVTRFVEKPDAARAAEMAVSGRHLWNAGVFLMRVGDVIAAFERYAPELVAPCRAALDSAAEDLGFLRLGPEYAEAEDISIDFAVMEKADRLAAAPLDAGWSDLGAWDALWEAAERDANGVAISGPAIAKDCRDTLLRTEEPGMTLIGLGLDRIVAVAMRDAVLVADMDRAQEVKGLVAELKAAGIQQATDYPRFHRPWGWYETLCMDSRFQVKRICVKPGGLLSLQSHVHRSEHWVVVAGTAKVTVGEEVKLLTENQSVYIPLGAVHRMENPGKLPMYLIEVQTGAYLGEDDIIRYEDIYDRN